VTSRRGCLIALCAGAFAAPLRSHAQQAGRVWRVGYLLQGADRPENRFNRDAFLRGMRDLGYVGGKNLIMELRSADDRVERLPGLAAELVQLKVDVIVTAGTIAVSAAQKATATIPIVFGNVADPVGSGFVRNLARPGGNITGLSNVAVDIGSKLLEMLLSMVPKVTRVAILLSPDNPSHASLLKNVQSVAASRAGVRIVPVHAQTPAEIETAFSMMAREKAEAVIIPGETLFNFRGHQIAQLALKNRLPSICVHSQYVEHGGLMSYGHHVTAQYQRAATYVDKIFKGAKPGDLPVERPTTLELTINRKTATALGINIPQEVLLRADRVIE
jgi:putative tryptophan/tyrosine transport system substrate-binding protein